MREGTVFSMPTMATLYCAEEELDLQANGATSTQIMRAEDGFGPTRHQLPDFRWSPESGGIRSGKTC